MSGAVDVGVMLKKAEQEAEFAGFKGDARDYKRAGTEYASLVEDHARLQARLEHNRCNSGHETLPLVLWDCPECHNETRRKLAELIEATARLATAAERRDTSIGCPINVMTARAELAEAASSARGVLARVQGGA